MKAATPSPRGLGKRSEGDSRACRPHRPLAKSFGVARVPAAEHMANYQAARRSWARERAAQRRALRRRRNQRNDPGDRLQRNEEVLMLSKPSLRGAAAKYQIACSRILSEFRWDPSPAPISEFQPFPCRPSGDDSGEKLKALLSQREVMLQLPFHSRPQSLRWTCACKVPRIFPPGFDQA